jgi:predicted transposase YdaD
VIKQMHTKGMSIQQIADIVEMPVDEIQAIVQL